MNSEKTKRKRKIATLMVILNVIVISWYYLNQGVSTVGENLFTEADLKILEGFENHTMTVGYLKGLETNSRKAIKEVMVQELSIEVEMVQYDNYEELEAAAMRGEIDLFINIGSGEKRDQWTSISFPLINTTYAITNRYNPLENVNEFSNSKVGFLSNSFLYEDYQGVIGEAYFFDSMDEVLEALENQEIDAFLTRIDWVVEELVPRVDLQIEFTFQHRITDFEIITANNEFDPLLDIVGEIVHSPRASIVKEKLEITKQQQLASRIEDYIQETYASIIETKDILEVGHHEMNFPYIYFDEFGASSGIYIEKLELFQAKTGIRYNVQNRLGATHYTDLFQALKANQIHYLFGVGNVHDSEVLVTLAEVQEEIVSIATYENKEIATRALSEIKFGIVTTPDAADQILGQTNYILFEDYDSAIEALVSGEIDVLKGRHSTLMYYRNVLGYTGLIQVDIISGVTEHSILGNVANEDLNRLLLDIQRLYYLTNTEDPETLGVNLAIDYQSRYLALRNRQEKIVVLGFLVVILVAILMIFKMRKQNQFLKFENERDKLTGLYNRKTADKIGKALIEKNPNKFGAFFFFDLDDLKFCNDTYGHATGDKLITEFANQLQKFEDENTVCSRIAGDEFSVFKMGFQTRDEVVQVMTQIKQDLKCTLQINDEMSLPVSFSAGGSIYNSDTTDFSNLKKYADLAMYQTKYEKKKRQKEERESATVKLFDLELLRMKSNHLIETILNGKQIYAVYQSIHSMESGEIYGYEGLTRTTNPRISNVFELIKLAESKGKLQELDLLMMETIVQSFKGTGNLFINMEYKSPELIEDYITRLRQLASENKILMSNLVLEVSERNQWSQESIRILNELKEKYKFRVAVDDFGVGFANIQLLMNLKPDIVKIDRSLLSHINEDSDKYQYLKTLIDFIKKQRVEIIYEGIETAEELNTLKTISLDLGQGWYFNKPCRLTSS